ncbi:MAG: hypothetical protein ACK55I_04920, partial [bacterium]
WNDHLGQPDACRRSERVARERGQLRHRDRNHESEFDDALDRFDGDVCIARRFDGGQSICEVHERADAHQRDHRRLGDGVRGGSVRRDHQLGFCDL